MMIRGLALSLLLPSLTLAACGDDIDQQPTAFALRFAALADGQEVGCADVLTGFGPGGGARIGINDLRLYVSNVRFLDADGRPVKATLDVNEFQYAAGAGSVALIDLTGNTEGSCSSAAVAYAEGTARTHDAITGTTAVQDVATVSFDLGVPQGLMKDIIETNTPEGAPSPLNEMYWNWNSGYRHVVFNFSVRDAADAVGEGYVHIGSRGCGPADGKALEDREACTFVNTPAVSLSAFDLASDTIGIDLRRVVEGLDFVAPIYDPVTFEEIGQGPGVECHSSPMQPDCSSIFGSFGVDMASGVANSTENLVLTRMR